MKNLLLTEVHPDAIYRYGKPGKTVRIACDNTQGWLRGHVLVRGFGTSYRGFSAVVTLQPVFGGQSYDVHVFRRSFSEPWFFDNAGYEKIFQIEHKKVQDLIDTKISEATLRIQGLYATIAATEREIEKLKQLKI